MPLWKKTTLYPCLPCSRFLLAYCLCRLTSLLSNLPDVPVSSQAAAAAAALPALLQCPLLSAVLPLQLGPVPPAVERLPQLERLLAVVLPLQ